MANKVKLNLKYGTLIDFKYKRSLMDYKTILTLNNGSGNEVSIVVHYESKDALFESLKSIHKSLDLLEIERLFKSGHKDEYLMYNNFRLNLSVLWDSKYIKFRIVNSDCTIFDVVYKLDTIKNPEPLLKFISSFKLLVREMYEKMAKKFPELTMWSAS